MGILYFIVNILLFSSFIFAQSTQRDTLALNEILVETNRLKMTKVLAPNKIQLFDENYISSLNGNRVSDLLQYADAVFIKDYGFNSGIKTISVNSTQSENTLILMDGVRLNSRQNSLVDLSLFDMDNVSRIEVSKGGSSALYGSDAIGGVINIITGNNDSPKFLSMNIKSRVGSYGMREFFGRLSQDIDLGRNKYISYNISGTDERAENNFDYYYDDGLTEVRKTRENSDYNTQDFDFDINYKSQNETLLKLSAYYSHFERGVPGIELGYPAGTARQVDYNSISSFSFKKQLSSRLNFKTDINYKYSLQKYYDTATFNLSVKINSYYKQNSYTNTSSFGYLPGGNFEIESGYEISYNNISSNETEPGELIQGAVFSAASYKLKSKAISAVTIYPSIRYDYFSNINQKHVITGKFGINIKPLDKTGLSFKSTIGNNFRAPTFNELYWKDLGNKDLKPELSLSFDAGVFYRFYMILLNEIEFSYYNINTTDRIVWTPVSGSIWRPINVGKVKSEGIDVSLRSGIVTQKHFNVSLNFNYNYGSSVKKNEDFPGDPSYNKQLIYLPKEMIKSSFMFNYLPTSKFIKYVSFNLFYSYITRRYTNFENTQFAPRFDILDGNAGMGFNVINTEIGVKFIINNILNEDYQVVSGYPMPLRNFKLEISFKY